MELAKQIVQPQLTPAALHSMIQNLPYNAQLNCKIDSNNKTVSMNISKISPTLYYSKTILSIVVSTFVVYFVLTLIYSLMFDWNSERQKQLSEADLIKDNCFKQF